MEKNRSVIIKKLREKYDATAAKKYEAQIFETTKNISGKNTYAKIAYQKVGEFLACNEKLTGKILDDLSVGKLGYESSLYDENRRAVKLKTKKLLSKPKPVKGIHVCKNRINGKVCGCDEFYMWTAQTRSGDESSTHFRQCGACSKRYKEN